MGSDLTVVNAARVSFDKESEWEKIELDHFDILELSEKDQKLIKYLATHNHWTPFSHVMITMRETVPIFVARQRFKHMVGFTYNEVSRRYVDDEPKFYIPDAWRKRAEDKKQGSSDEFVEECGNWTNKKVRADYYEVSENSKMKISTAYSEFIRWAEIFYQELLASDVAPEQARMILPQSTYTSYYTTGSLAAWARAYKLRIEEHAQKEIQDLAIQWNEVISEIKELQHSWKALTDAENT
jgi:thymidylate synthase (FAD)